MKNSNFFYGLLLLPFFVSAHPMPNTFIALSVNPQHLVFDIKIPLTDVDLAIFQKPDTTFNLDERLPVFEVLKIYFYKHLKVEDMDGVIWPSQLISVDTLEAEDPFVGKFKEFHAVLHVTPSGNNIRQFLLYYDAIIHQIVTHQAILSLRQDWDNGIHTEEGDTSAQILAVIQVDQPSAEILPVAVKLESGSIWIGFVAMFRLGMRHIAEGYDHLLFLIVLLFPAPLLSDNRRWGKFGGWQYSFIRILKIVTAFTIGHSLTLVLAALGWCKLPTQPVEVVIALSILASSIHAIRPYFDRRESWVAAGFGLVHGLAFASILSNLHLDSSRLTWSILGFNLGIEAMQMLVVLVVLPLLMVLSRMRYYSFIRVTGAICAGGLALFWAIERVMQLV